MDPHLNKRTRRVGTVTCGAAFILFGLLFLLHMIVPAVSYLLIFRLWPCILIMLGIEILIGNIHKTSDYRYDKGAIFLLMILSCFAIIMAIADECIRQIPQELVWSHTIR